MPPLNQDLRHSPIPEEQLLQTFKTFDYDNSGAIDERELCQAMKMLGVHCSLNTAKKVLSSMDSNSDGLIQWNEFQGFFAKVSDPEDVKDLLSSQCHRFFEYKQAVENDPTFAKTFHIPPAMTASRRLEGHQESVESVAWLSDNELLSGSIDGEVLVWAPNSDVAAGAKLKPSTRFKAAGAAALYSMAVDEASRCIVAGLDGRGESCLRLIGVDDQAERMAYQGHTVPVYSCAMSPETHTLASGGKLGVLCAHDLERDVPLVSSQAHHGVIHSVAFQPGSTIICTASKDGTMKIFDARNLDPHGKCEQVAEDAATGGAVLQAMPVGEFGIISCGEDYCIKRWDSRQLTMGPVMSYFGHTAIVRSIDVNSDGRLIASGTKSGSVRIWNTDELGELEAKLEASRSELCELRKGWPAKEDGFEAGRVEVEELKAYKANMVEHEERCAAVTESTRELRRRGYAKAVLGCEAGKLPVSQIAWRRGAGSGPLTVAVASQDQSVYVFEIDPSRLSETIM